VRDIPIGWLIVLLIAGYVMVNQVYLPYKTIEMGSRNFFCDKGVVMEKNSMALFGLDFAAWSVSLNCIEYKG